MEEVSQGLDNGIGNLQVLGDHLDSTHPEWPESELGC